jgi:hypothetical protein
MNEGNRAMCCSVGDDSGCKDAWGIGVMPEATEGDGDGGSWTLVVESALPLDLAISSNIAGIAQLTSWCPALASSSNLLHHS